MKTKSKIIIFVCAFALIFSLVSVTCFARVSKLEEGLTYRFIDYPTVIYPDGSDLEFDESGSIELIVDDSVVSIFVVSGGFIELGNDDFVYRYNGSQWLYLSDGEVFNSDPPAFVLEYLDPSVSSYFYDWLVGNVDSVEVFVDNSFYHEIFSSIQYGVFGDSPLTSEQVFTLTLVSTILSYAFILLPLLLVIGFVLRCFRL